jgi:hypothetical protein
LFIGTEFGIYFSLNKGTNWIQLKSGLPTIPFRDIELHPRDNDLVAGSFGRGVYVLDDYSPLREMTDNATKLFSVRDAWFYIPNVPLQALGMPSAGSNSFRIPNPPFGALITYYISELPKTSKEARKESEKKLNEQNASIPFPGWDRLNQESKEMGSQVLMLIRDEKGAVVRWVKGEANKGLNRVYWDLRLPAPDPISLTKPAFTPPWAGTPQGPLAAPGTYTAELYMAINGNLEVIGSPQKFSVKPIPALDKNTDYKAVAQFQKRTNDLSREGAGAVRKLGEASTKLNHIKAALLQTVDASPELIKKLNELNGRLFDLNMALTGDPAREEKNESTAPAVMSRVWGVMYGHWETSQAPTETMKREIDLAEKGFRDFVPTFDRFFDDLKAYEVALQKAGAPWTPGRN